MKVPVTVTEGGSMLGSPIVLAVIGLLVIGVGYYLYRRRKTTA
jgi:LPXTG-motif cell wall-anchored protein